MSIIQDILSGIGVFWAAEKDKINANFAALNADKAENSTLPTNTSDLTNDSNFVADASYIATDNNFTDAAADAIIINNAKRSYPAADETRLANTSGTNTGDQDLSAYATSVDVASDLLTKVDVDGGKVLTDVNFSPADKVLVDTIADKQSAQTGYGLSQNNYSDADADLVSYLPINTIDSLNLKADLDAGLVPLAQLPDVVKDGGIVQYNDLGSFPNPGDEAILYLAKDTNIIYRWNGSAYAAIVAGVTSGTVLEDVELKNYSETVDTPSIMSGVLTLNIENGNVFDVELTEDVTTLTFDNPPDAGKGGSFALLLRQDSTGGRSLVWPTAIAWAGGTVPTLTTTADAIDILTFITIDEGTTWYGILGGSNFV